MIIVIVLAGFIFIGSAYSADIDVQSVDDNLTHTNQENINEFTEDSSILTVDLNKDSSAVNNNGATQKEEISQLGDTTKNFTQLEKDLNSGTLSGTYKYDGNNFFDGIEIKTNNTIIDGHGCTIDGSNHAKIFYIQVDNVTLINFKFINCSGHFRAGAITLNGENDTVRDCTFENCYSFYDDGSGGAIEISNYGKSTIVNCNFNDCSSRLGGAIFVIGDESDCTIKNCTFKNCYSVVGGGAIEGRLGTIENCNFNNCTSGAYGGAIYIYYSDINVKNSNFTNCSASYGSAIVWEDGDSYKGNISHCQFFGSNDDVICIPYSGRTPTLFLDHNYLETGYILKGKGVIITSPTLLGNYYNTVKEGTVVDVVVNLTDINGLNGKQNIIIDEDLKIHFYYNNYPAVIDDNNQYVFTINTTHTPSGEYKLTTPSKDYSNLTTNMTLIVIESDVRIIMVTNVTYGNDVKITVDIKGDKGTINIFNGTNKLYSKSVSKSDIYTYSIPNLDSGIYNDVYAIYEDDTFGNISSKDLHGSKSFTVYKADTLIKVNGTDFSGIPNQNVTGPVTILVKGTTTKVNVSDVKVTIKTKSGSVIYERIVPVKNGNISFTFYFWRL